MSPSATRRTLLLAASASLALLVFPASPDATPSRAGGEPQFAPCGYGFPQKPPKHYRFQISGTVTSPNNWIDGKETYVYRGKMVRKICRGTRVEYWQTGGTVTQTFTNILVAPEECDFTGNPPHYGFASGPTSSRPLKRFEVDVGFVWTGNSYVTSVINPRRDDDFAHGTLRCPNPPAANGTTVPVTFRHISTDLFTKKGRPEKVVKGRIRNYLDGNLYRHSFRWKLTAAR